MHAEDFSNWYFKAHSKALEVTGKTKSPEGELLGTFTGSSTGTLDADASTFIEKFEYTYFPGGQTFKFKIVWTKGEDGIYKAAAEGSDGSKSNAVLTIVSETVYRVKFVRDDGLIIKTEGKLDKENSIHTTDTGINTDGKTVLLMTYTQSRPAQKT